MDSSTALTPPEKIDGVLEKTPRHRWGPWATLGWGVGIAIVTIGSQTLGAAGYLVGQGLLSMSAPIPIDNIASNGPLLATALLVATPAVLGIIWLAVRLSRVPIADYLALKLPGWRDIGWGLLALTLVLLAAGVATELTGQETPEFMADTFKSAQEAGLLWLVLISFVVLGPLQEELLFRGFFYRGFALALGPAPAIVLISALWAVIHLQYEWFFIGEIFALGITFGWARWKSNSTLLPLLLHMMVNGAALLSVALQ